MEKLVIELTKQLITIPSSVNKTTNEVAIVRFLERFFQKELPSLTIKKQYIDNQKKRYNLLINEQKSPTLLILGHVDTVQPKIGWDTNSVIPEIKNKKLYGLGAADMKGSLAAFLTTLVRNKASLNLDRLMMLWYVDEEYSFKGMRSFLKNSLSSNLQPGLVLSLDGGLSIASGCRGFIESSMITKGKSGHSTDPSKGINAITKTVKLLEELKRSLAQKRDPLLGKETQPGDACPCCQTPLQLAYPQNETATYIQGELNKPDASLFLLKKEREIVGFSWGFSYESPEAFAEEKYRTSAMQQSVANLLRESCVSNRVYYLSESGILDDPELRGRGISNQFHQVRLDVAQSLGMPALQRTSCEGAMYRTSLKSGMTQIMGPEVVVDTQKRTFTRTGRVINNCLDTEIESRVLFMK